MSILSIQSHVAFGHVGNDAAVLPLQLMGHEVWPIHTVQFSNHTGYGAWTGQVFDAALAEGIRVAPGLMFSNSGRFDHFLRISCGTPFNPNIEAALKRLGQIVAAGG